MVCYDSRYIFLTEFIFQQFVVNYREVKNSEKQIENLTECIDECNAKMESNNEEFLNIEKLIAVESKELEEMMVNVKLWNKWLLFINHTVLCCIY